MGVEAADTVAGDNEVQRRLETLAKEITERGALRTPLWRQVFTRVRRDVFLPRYWHDEEPAPSRPGGEWVDGASPADHDKWLRGVYSDRPLVTDLKESRSQPSAAAALTRSSPAPPPCPD